MSFQESTQSFHARFIKDSYIHPPDNQRLCDLARSASLVNNDTSWNSLQDQQQLYSKYLSIFDHYGLVVFPNCLDIQKLIWLQPVLFSATNVLNRHDLSFFLSHEEVRSSLINTLPNNLFHLCSLDAQCPLFVDSISLVFNSSSLNNPNSLLWHRDRDSHLFRKVFVYLTDIEAGDGHHEFIPYSHKLPPHQYDEGFYKSSDIHPLLSTSSKTYKPLKVTGKSGTVFLENTRGLHRGTDVTKDSSRLMLSLTLSASSIASSYSQPNYIRSLCSSFNEHLYANHSSSSQ